MTMLPNKRPRPRHHHCLPVVLLLLTWVMLSACSKTDQQIDWQTRHLYQTAMEEMARGDLTTAISNFRRVLEKQARHTGALCKLAEALLKVKPRTRQQVAEAVRLAVRATEIDPRGQIGWAVLAQAWEQAGKLPQALQARQRLIELNPIDFANVVQTARLAVKTGQDRLALDILQKGLVPGADPVRLELGKYFLAHDQQQQALEQFRAITKGSDEYLLALDEMGALAARQGDFARVREVYSELVQLAPQDNTAWELLAAVDEREGKFADAEQKYRRSLDINRRSTRSWTGLARCLLAQQKQQQGRYAIRQADALVASEPSRAVELAEVLAGIKEYDWARSVLKRARLASNDQQVTKAIETALAKIPAAGNHQKPAARSGKPGRDMSDGGRQGAVPR